MKINLCKRSIAFLLLLLMSRSFTAIASNKDLSLKSEDFGPISWSVESVHEYFEYVDSRDKPKTLIIGSGRAGGISNLAMPLGTSAMMSTVADISLPDQLSDDHLSEFNYENSSEKGAKRKAIKDKFNSLTYAQKGEFEESVRAHYRAERQDTAWVRSSGLLWTGWKFTINLTHQNKKLETGADRVKHEAEVLIWLSRKFNEGYYLYYGNKWKLSTSTGSINLDFKQFKDDNPYSTMDELEFVDIVNNSVIFKLNRARALSGVFRELGNEELASVIMPSGS